jgi:hypothetical protein
MTFDPVSRRSVLRSLGVGAVAGSVLRVIPLEAAEFAHGAIAAEKSAAKGGAYVPKYFLPQQYKTLQTLCETILPADADSGGAIDAGAPEFIDLLTSENPDYQVKLGGGMEWLESTCVDRYGSAYLDCTPVQQKEILDQVAFAKNEEKDPTLGPGIEFFSLLRSMTADGFFTSKIGIKYLGYQGNVFLTEFPGCPPLPSA